VVRIRVTEDGPYEVEGAVPIAQQIIEPNDRGESWEWREGVELQPPAGVIELCRCGGSATKPFCDGTHKTNGFDGTEVADRRPYLEQADVFEGPRDALTDASQLCAYARFCDAMGQVWNLVDVDDPDAVALTEREASNCPAGRLVAWRTRDVERPEPVEPDLEPSIGVVEDPATGVSGPLWVRGGIQVVAADGTAYEIRNRVTLCRCGASRNKPFCDGTHAAIGFTDGLPLGGEP
jgi:CDGSH-type Zn-finger protein